MRIIDIIEGTSVDGPGLRTSVYMAGCAHRCPGCHNPSTWPMDAGSERDVRDLAAELIAAGLDVTLSGGDPLYQPAEVAQLVHLLKVSGLGVWLYTGFTYEQINASPTLRKAISEVDVVVDGPYVQSLRDPDLHFRGSSNQRLIDNKRSTPGEVILWQSPF